MLLILAFFLLKPILLSIIIAIILAFIFKPIYSWILKRIKYKNLAAAIVCFLLLLIIAIPFWFLTPIIIDQSFKFFVATQQIDIITPLQKVFPSLFASEAFSKELGNILTTFISKAVNYLTNTLSNLILNFITLFLQLVVVFFTFFFVLRDSEKLIEYIKSLMPFSKEVEIKLFEYSKGITASVIYGQVVVGILQGILAGVGFFLFGVPNALLLTLLACLGGILPIVGTVVIWIPVVIYLLIAGNNFAAMGVSVFGLFSSTIDNFLRPIIVSKRTHIPSSVVLIGMIGGFFLFGILGFILGPLILAYLLIFLELYRNKRIPGIFIQHSIDN
jgi:predicted PurR-regulated permease PerM